MNDNCEHFVKFFRLKNSHVDGYCEVEDKLAKNYGVSPPCSYMSFTKDVGCPYYKKK